MKEIVFYNKFPVMFTEKKTALDHFKLAKNLCV